MINTAKTVAAASLAQRAHSGQLDKAGEPYVKHAFAVAEKMDDEDSTCAALLHDVVEDTDFTLDDLRAIGMSEAVVEAVDLLTRGPDQDYFAYVLALRDHPDCFEGQARRPRAQRRPFALQAFDVVRYAQTGEVP